MGALPEEVRRVLGPLEQELQMAVGHHMNAGIKPRVLWRTVSALNP